MKCGYNERPWTASVEPALPLSFTSKHVWATLVAGAGPVAMITKINKYFLSGVGRFLKDRYLPSGRHKEEHSVRAQRMLQSGRGRERLVHKLQCNVVRASAPVLRAEHPSWVEGAMEEGVDDAEAPCGASAPPLLLSLGIT